MAIMEESNYQGRTVLQNWIQSKQQSWDMYKCLWYTRWVVNWFQEDEDLKDWTWERDWQGYMLWRHRMRGRWLGIGFCRVKSRGFSVIHLQQRMYHSLDWQCILHINSISKEFCIFSYYQLISFNCIMTFPTWKH